MCTKKNTPKPIRKATEGTPIKRSIVSAAMDVIIVPIEPVNKHPTFFFKQYLVRMHKLVQELKNSTPRT